MVELRGFEPLTFSLRMALGLVRAQFSGEQKDGNGPEIACVAAREQRGGNGHGAHYQLGKMEDLRAMDALAP